MQVMVQGNYSRMEKMLESKLLSCIALCRHIALK